MTSPFSRVKKKSHSSPTTGPERSETSERDRGFQDTAGAEYEMRRMQGMATEPGLDMSKNEEPGGGRAYKSKKRTPFSKVRVSGR